MHTQRETIYFGVRLQGEARVYKRSIICGGEAGLTTAIDPRTDLRNHSPTGLEWGYCGSGPAQLALALLADHLRDDALALSLYQNFKRCVVARIERDLSWTLPASRLAEMAAALAANQICESLGREHLAEVVDFNAYKLRKTNG